jgi:hypothetical protein
MLAGISVRDADVLELAPLLREGCFVDVAETLENAYDRETKVLALTIVDRESILRALDDPPTDALAQLRARLSGGCEKDWCRGADDIRSLRCRPPTSCRTAPRRLSRYSTQLATSQIAAPNCGATSTSST